VVIDDADHNPVALFPSVLSGGINAAEITAVQNNPEQL
jgi:hypothetical protein